MDASNPQTPSQQPSPQIGSASSAPQGDRIRIGSEPVSGGLSDTGVDPADVQTVEGPMPGKYRVKVVRSKCIGAGTCVAIAPKVFQFDDQTIAVVISQDELDDIKLLAAQSCPTMAIIVEDIETGKQVWPEEE